MNIYIRMPRSKIVCGAAISFCFAACSMSATNTSIGDVESTMAYRLIVIEENVGNPAPGTQALFRKSVESATNAALAAINQYPPDKLQAREVLRAIHNTFAQHNFLQPISEIDWPDTLGVAFSPLQLPSEQLSELMRYNGQRAKFVDVSKPVYYVDCDMGALLFIAVGQRLGWDFRLVEVPNHNFIRWHISDGVYVNWDWTAGESIETRDYMWRVPETTDHRIRDYYLSSLPVDHSRAYFKGLIASEGGDPKQVNQLFEEAIEVLPHHPLTLNNYAWFLATDPNAPGNKSDLAVRYALAAWSLKPSTANFIDTVACAFAADDEKDVAVQIANHAIEKATTQGQRASFVQSLQRIQDGRRCE